MAFMLPQPVLLRRSLRRLRRAVYPLGLTVIEAWARAISDAGCERWARRFGTWAYWLLLPERRRAQSNLTMALGNTLAPPRIRQVALAAFRNLAFGLLESLRFQWMEPEQILARIGVEGWEHVVAAHQRGRGGIFVTGHLGNWELAAICAALRGYPMNVVARRIYIERINRKLVQMRERMGIRVLYRDRSMRDMIRCLKDNQFVGILPDQDVRRVSGIFVEFFKRPAYTPVGPALLALASGAPILVARDIREGSRHRMTVDPPLYGDRNAPRQAEVRRLVTSYTRRLETFIREYPEQWVWMHRRWRTRPGDPRLKRLAQREHPAPPPSPA